MDVSKETTTRDDDHGIIDRNDNINTILIRILQEVGYMFEYLQTINIIKLLTLSHVLINFKGIYHHQHHHHTIYYYYYYYYY